MTLQEMIKKIEVYNEVAYVLGYRKQALEINDYSEGCSCRMFSVKATSYKELKKALKAEYIDEYVTEIITRDDYEFDTGRNVGRSYIETMIVDL